MERVERLRVGAGTYAIWDMASLDANEISKDTSMDIVTRWILSRLVEAWEMEDGK